MVLGSVDIFVRSRPRVHPYFQLLMSDLPVGWQKVWFFLRNDANAPLPMFTGSRPIPQHKWGMVWPRNTSAGYNHLRDVVQQLLRGGLTGADLCQPPHPTTLLVRNDHVDVSRTNLSRSSLLHRVGWHGGQHPDLRGPYSWDRSDFWLRPGPFTVRGRQPLDEFARGRRPTMLTTNGSKHKGKGGRLRVPPRHP
jgi:hypothetical protein